MAIVTDLREERSKVWVYFDGKRAARLTRALMAERRLAVGEELDDAEFFAWLCARELPAAREYALNALASNARTERTLRDSLARRGHGCATIDALIAELRARGLIDDAAYAQRYAELRAAREGKRTIAAALMRRGVSRERVQSAMEAVPGEEQLAGAAELARRLVAKHGASREGLQKCAQALARRGYDWDTIGAALREASAEDGDTLEMPETP